MQWTVGCDREITDALTGVALESAAAGSLPAEAVLPGVRALDLWSEGPNAAILFWVDRGTDGNALREPELHDVIVTRGDERGAGGRRSGPYPRGQLSAPGLPPLPPCAAACCC
jgi:hypothetical protein